MPLMSMGNHMKENLIDVNGYSLTCGEIWYVLCTKYMVDSWCASTIMKYAWQALIVQPV